MTPTGPRSTPAEARARAAQGPTASGQSEHRYMNMLLALDGIPRLHNMLAAFFTWILLAALCSSRDHVPLFVIAFVCSGIGVLGMLWLWWRWNRNYIWLNNRIFLPGALNSLAGIISTLVNVYSAQHGEFVTTSRARLYAFKLKKVKQAHNRQVGRERAGRHGEGILEEIKRKAKEIEPEAGMV
ncbi:hypothetical protein B0H13DRAFT_2663928 [Mycena leptocephala]|nr:hypothetical protein B0H13DRAFT_2663928 [Mycena leptocephala]